jgi:hypothetical protein
MTGNPIRLQLAKRGVEFLIQLKTRCPVALNDFNEVV